MREGTRRTVSEWLASFHLKIKTKQKRRHLFRGAKTGADRFVSRNQPYLPTIRCPFLGKERTLSGRYPASALAGLHSRQCRESTLRHVHCCRSLAQSDGAQLNVMNAHVAHVSLFLKWNYTRPYQTSRAGVPSPGLRVRSPAMGVTCVRKVSVTHTRTSARAANTWTQSVEFSVHVRNPHAVKIIRNSTLRHRR